MTWKGEIPQRNEEAPLRYPASNQDHIPPLPQEDEQKSPGKGPSRNKTPTPEKTRLPEKALDPGKIRAPDKVSTPKNPVREKAPDSDRIPTAENTTLDKAATPGSTLSGDDPAKGVALHEDNGPALVKILTPEHMIFKEEPSRDSTQGQHLSQEETTQRSESPASSNDIQVPGECSPQPNSSERSSCHVKQVNGSPAQSKAEDPSDREEAQVLEEPLTKDETTLHKAPPKKLPSEGAGPQKQVPPTKESVPTPQVPHTTKLIPDPEEAPTHHPSAPLTSLKSKNYSRDELESLKEEVASLRGRLELLEQKLK